MRVKITDVGAPFYYDGKLGFIVGFEYNSKHVSTFVKLGENLKLALYNAVNTEEMRLRAMVEAGEFAQEVKRLIGSEIEVP